MKKHKTRNDMASNTKTFAVALLNKTLATLIDLSLITKQAHWNLKGHNFIGVHEMLDDFRTVLDGHVDIIAERVVQLGATAYGTTQMVQETSSLQPYPTTIYKVHEHILALIERYGIAANQMRKAIDEAADAGDADTADIFTAASRDLDKNLWFLEAHIQEA